VGPCLESNLRPIDDQIVTSHYTNSALLPPIIIIIIIIIIIPADRNVVEKDTEKKLKYKSLCMYRDTANVEPEMYGYTGNNWSHWNSNEKLKEKFGRCYQENIR
jgi:hypothetical protein